ncbi:YfhE family protein [Bacillus marinisedimentorum]|nr:YfhE family protein [Bacillus marinisedimentorum]
MEAKRKKEKAQRKTLRKTQEVLYGHEFRAADRAGGK